MKKANYRHLFATLVAMIVLISSIGTASAVKLSDVEGHPAQKAIEALADAGAIVGSPGGTFLGELSITRAEFALILNKYLGFSSTDAEPFADTPEGKWYTEALTIAKSAGYIAGIGDNMGSPTHTMTRQEAFTMIAKVYGLSAAGEAAVQLHRYKQDGVEQQDCPHGQQGRGAASAAETGRMPPPMPRLWK